MQLGFLFLVPLLYWILHVVSPFSIWYILLRSLMLRNIAEMRWYKTHVARSMRSPHHPIIQKWVKLLHDGMVYCNLFIGNFLIYDLLYYDETYEMKITSLRIVRQFLRYITSGVTICFEISLFSTHTATNRSHNHFQSKTENFTSDVTSLFTFNKGLIPSILKRLTLISKLTLSKILWKF